jgi:hypothetical protein
VPTSGAADVTAPVPSPPKTADGHPPARRFPNRLASEYSPFRDARVQPNAEDHEGEWPFKIGASPMKSAPI